MATQELVRCNGQGLGYDVGSVLLRVEIGETDKTTFNLVAKSVISDSNTLRTIVMMWIRRRLRSTLGIN